MGSIAELETQLILSAELYPQTKTASEALLVSLDGLNRMMRAIIHRLD